MKSLKLKSYPGENFTDLCAAILLGDELLESAGAFNTEHLGYITCIFEDNSESRLHIWAIHNYREVTEFTKKLRVCDMDVISQEDLTTYEDLLQDATREYCNIVNQKRREPATGKVKSQEQTSLPKTYTVAIEQSTNKALKQIQFKSRQKIVDIFTGRESHIKSYVTCHKCGKKVHTKKECRPKGTGSSGNQPKKYENEIPEWVTKKPVVSYIEILATDTMARNNKKHKWCISCNNGNGVWGFH